MSKNSQPGRPAKIFSFHPTGEYYFTRGLKAYHGRDLYKAKKYLERALELEPAEPMIACQLAITCTEIGDYSYSNNLLENIIDVLDPYMTECHYFLANNYAHLGMFKEAYLHANKYLDREEDGEFSEDAEDLLDLITSESDETVESLVLQDSLIGRHEEARGYLEAGNFLKAVELLKDTIEEYEDYWSAYNNLALAYFYLGKTEEAFATLEDVLERNPGNLHALCNMLVFHYYQHNEEEVDRLAGSLDKIRPILSEHRFKLGSTFALIGKYEQAYSWLRHLEKQGFEGDGTFYYWLASSAYQLNRIPKAEQAWKKVVELNPEKAGMEPWGDISGTIHGFEHHLPSILKRLGSDFAEERLFAIFLTKHSMKKQVVVKHESFTNNELFGPLEKAYRNLLHSNGINGRLPEIVFADETAERLYEHFSPIQFREAGLFLMWFSVFAEAAREGRKMANPPAWAAAVEYTWYKLRNEKAGRQQIADKYSVSPATLSKYAKMVQELLQ